MSRLTCGIVGLPNVGKSSLFNALTKLMIAANNFPFCTIEPNLGIVDVPDPLLEELGKKSESAKIVPATIAFVDIAGLVKGASKGEGLGNKFLANIRETDLIIHMVRCFEDEAITHVEGRVHPTEDIHIIELELILADLQMATNSADKLAKQAKGQKELPFALQTLNKCIDHLNNNEHIRTLELTPEETEALTPYPFLTAKPIIYVPNVSENDLGNTDNPYVKEVESVAKTQNAAVVPISAKLEEELSTLDEAEAVEFLQSLGLQEGSLGRLIRCAFDHLGLITFYTTGKKESRAWTIRRGMTAPQAAGKIHTDLQKGFIRAEVIKSDQVLDLGWKGAKEAGKSRMEGKQYIVQPDDVIVFYHST